MASSDTSRIRAALVTDVKVRRVSPGAEPPTDGETSGFGWDAYLRCEEVVWRAGTQFGHASLSAITRSGEVPGVENAWQVYWPDDQVQIVAYAGGDEYVLLEGPLSRQPFGIQRQGAIDSEDIGFVATPLPAVENRLSEHLVAGRWMKDLAAGATTPYFVAESAELPAVFNYRGRPNMGKADDEVAANGIALTGRLFTHDDDDEGDWWTVGKALASLLTIWLFGDATLPRKRMSCLEPETLAAIAAGSGSGERWLGLDKRLPADVDVRGLGIWDAVDAVCRAGGFGFAVFPLFDSGGSPVGDRTYALRVARRGGGPVTELRLPKRRDGYSGDVSSDLKRANVSVLSGMWDTVGVVNEVFATGETLLEVTVPLKPLWRPADISTQAIDSKLQDTQENQDEYHKRHVTQGDEFKTYGHVGRAWGLDCTGAFVRARTGYTAAPYQHNVAPHDKGFDWVSYLGLTAGAIATERTAAGITTPIKWSRRVRRALPLNRPEAQLQGIDYVLECTEDTGGTWKRVDLNFSTLRGYFGILLTDAKTANLAKVTLATLGQENPSVDVNASWWKLIQSDQRKLQFRLTCLIEADHAARHDALIQTTAGSAYRKGVVVETDIRETWATKNTFFNAAATFVKLQGFGVTGTKNDQSQTVKEAAERIRDAGEGARVAATADTWLMQPEKWRLLDSVWGLRGREISFGSDAGNSVRYPEIVGITFTLHGGGAGGSVNQGISLDIHDAAFGAGGGN